MIIIKSKREIELMRKSCKLAAETLEYIKEFVVAGATTEDLNNLCHEYIIKHNATPAPLNYKGFPKSICTSVNEVICHGIPSKKVVLKDGDIVNVDVTTILNDFHGDTNRTFFVGPTISPQVKHLVDTTFECLWAGIREVKHGKFLGDIGAAITEIAHANKYSVVEDYCGHGIGRSFHEDPQVLHFGVRGKGEQMKSGMTFTVEPMINVGTKDTKLLTDGWTVITKDKKLSAQFEHTILVTNDGFEVLTQL